MIERTKLLLNCVVASRVPVAHTYNLTPWEAEIRRIEV
jgi:hypothetical protein